MDGELSGLTVSAGGTSLLWGAGLASDEKSGRIVRTGEDQLLQGRYEGPARGIGSSYVEQLRDALERGKARATGRISEAGVEYWVVEYDPSADHDDLGEEILVTAQMRTSDYALKRLAVERRGENLGDGRYTWTDAFEWDAWGPVDRNSLQDGFFSLDAPVKQAKPGTKIEYEQVP
jgi:hypothetical protein